MPKIKEVAVEEQIAQGFFCSRTISKRILTEVYPILKQDPELLQLFMYLAFGPHYIDKHTLNIRLPRFLLARFMGYSDPNKVRTEKLLIKFKQAFPKFEYRDYYHDNNHEGKIDNNHDRQVLCTGIEEEIMQRFDDHMFDRVYANNLSKYSKRKEQEIYRELKSLVTRLEYPYRGQKKIADYLHSLPYEYFYNSVQENGIQAMLVAQETSTMEKKSEDHQIKLIRTLYDMPFPFYLPSQKEDSLTPRIYDRAATFLKKEVRHALFPDAFDLDLKNCQLVVLNMLSPIDGFKNILEEGQSVWPVLMDAMKIEEAYRILAKPHIKEAIYSLVYGMNVGNVELNLLKNFSNPKVNRGLIIPKQVSFVKLDLVREVAKSVDNLKKDIEEKKEFRHAYNNAKFVVKRSLKEEINSFISCIVQTYELACIEACYDSMIERKANHHQDSMIMLHQHDGISISLLNGGKKETVTNRLQKAVKERGEQYGMNMILE